MRRLVAGALLWLLELTCHAQLTTAQKVFDFQSLAALLAKRYAPYEWKRDVIGFDPMNTTPWLDRVTATRNDLDFYQILVEYVANLKDTHTTYNLPASFVATLGFDPDIYDNKVIIDYIDRNVLPAAQYPFQVGDQIVAIDGASVEDMIARYSVYGMQANERATRRMAVDRIFTRQQQFMPYAAQVGETATLTIQRRGGGTGNYTLKWIKSGLAVSSVGPVPSPPGRPGHGRRGAVVPGAGTVPADPLAELRNAQGPSVFGVFAMPMQSPIFYPPSGFQLRLGKATDYFVSGTFPSGRYTIGLLRIPTYAPADQAVALAQFQQEIAYFSANTDGLIIDTMRNNGGDLCFAESLVAHLAPNGYRTVGHEIRATLDFLQLLTSRIEAAKAAGTPAQQVAQYQAVYNALATAYAANRGRTDAIPLCSPTLDIPSGKDRNGRALVYSKPFVLLTDELTYSTAEAVAAAVQDNRLGQIAGVRTNGAGGSTGLTLARWPAGVYSEGSTGITMSLMVRPNAVSGTEYPATRYIENVGVRPDVAIEYMTLENLLGQGQAFINSVTAALIRQIQARGN